MITELATAIDQGRPVVLATVVGAAVVEGEAVVAVASTIDSWRKAPVSAQTDLAPS